MQTTDLPVRVSILIMPVGKIRVWASRSSRGNRYKQSPVGDMTAHAGVIVLR